MEQKQLDEIDESYFGEEFIDDEIELPNMNAKKKEAKKPKMTKIPPKFSHSSTKVTSSIASHGYSMKDERKDEPKATLEAQSKSGSTSGKNVPSTAEVKITPVKQGEHKMEKSKMESKATSSSLSPSTAEKSAPIDPWAELEKKEKEKKEQNTSSFSSGSPSSSSSGSFSKASTWKAITGILIILLIFSVFTQGFDFSNGKSKVTGAATLSLSDAETKVLDYVNTKLLQPPFTATVNGSEEINDNLYKISLSVAGQTIDSYLTKDGQYFFPQGFDTTQELAGAGDAAGDGTSPSGDGSAEEVRLVINTKGDPVIGDATAPVTIVEFSDFQCPFCARFYEQTLGQIESKYINTGKVKLVFRDFPLSFHEEAEPAALAAECAHEQGKFWEYHDLLFENQDQLGKDNYKKWAQEAGLDLPKFTACVESKKYQDEVQEDFTEGQQYGVTGTPGFFINGKLVSGAQPFTVFEQEIEAALAVAAGLAEAEEKEAGVEVVAVDAVVADAEDKNTADTKEVEEPTEEVPAEEAPTEEAKVKPTGSTAAVTVSSKKWSFTPNVVTVNEGDAVTFTIKPDTSNPTFTLSSFTFAIPGLGVEKEVSGTTTVEFTASKKGNFEFTCSSCEEWRGMTGTLVVK